MAPTTTSDTKALEKELDTLPSESVRIKRSDVLFDQTAKLGSGRFGIAYQGSLHPVTGDIGEIVAVKELFTVQDKTARDRLFQEIERTAPVWVGLTHPNINKFLGFCIDGEAMLLVSSLQNGGSLHALLEKGAVEYSRCLELITDMAQGLLYLHSRDPPICHGSIHPGNILVDPQGHAVLSDYDLMSTLERAEVDLANVTDGLWRYESPEVLKRKTPHTPCSDMWSLGCLIFKMVANQTLYADINHPDELKTTVDQGDMPYQVETIDCPARAQNLLGRCWQYAPESRASASEIVGILTGKSFRFGEVKDIPAKELDALRFSRDGKYLALVFGENRDSTVSIYDTETWDIALKLNYPPESSGAQTLQFSTSGRYLATAESKRFAILLWDLTSGELVSEFTGHKGTIWGVDISSGDSFIASGAGDKDPTLRLWHFKGHAGKNHVISVDDKNYFCSVAISPDSTYVVGGLHHGGAGIWNTQTGSRIFTVPDSYGWVRCVQFSPDGRWLVGGNMGGKYSRWEVSKLQESNDTPSLAIFPASNVVVSVSISPDNNWFVFLGETGDVRPVVKGETPESALPSIGKVPGHGIWRNVHLGPVSNTGSGLVAGFAGGGGDVVVAKYVSWDSPGAYRFKAKEVSDEGGSTDDGFPED
ncbi:hypothetical protein FRB99_003719 [Tulasnella sp. 403]|nr:hypothetical protein FRB99_003719 [Tulasnella sp. 403]